MVEEYFNENSALFAIRALISGPMMLGAVIGLFYAILGVDGWNNFFISLVAVMVGVLAFIIAPVKDDSLKLSKKRINKVKTFRKFPLHNVEHEQLEYVSVFYQREYKMDTNKGIPGSSKYYYYVKLWYPENRHVNIYKTDDRLIAIGAGYHIAKKLQVDCLDATHGADQRWVELNEDIEAYLQKL